MTTFSEKFKNELINGDYEFSGIDNNKFLLISHNSLINGEKQDDNTWKICISADTIFPSGNEITTGTSYYRCFIKDNDLNFLYSLPIKN